MMTNKLTEQIIGAAIEKLELKAVDRLHLIHDA